DRQLAAEAAAHEFADHLDLLQRDLERRGDRMVSAVDQLDGAMDRESVARPLGHAGMRLHRIVVLIRRGVGRIDLDRAVRKGAGAGAWSRVMTRWPRGARSASRLSTATMRRWPLVLVTITPTAGVFEATVSAA